MARTIDNLGLETSTRYATDQETFEESLIKEALTVSNQSSVSTTLPFFASEFEELFDLGKRRKRWASFKEPERYRGSRRRLFADQLIPGLGTPDFQETVIERIEAADEGSEEQKILLTLLQKVLEADQILIEINSRRSQYQKG